MQGLVGLPAPIDLRKQLVNFLQLRAAELLPPVLLFLLRPPVQRFQGRRRRWVPGLGVGTRWQGAVEAMQLICGSLDVLGSVLRRFRLGMEDCNRRKGLLSA